MRFLDIFEKQVDDIQRKMIDYVKLLKRPSTNQPIIQSAIPRLRSDLDIQTKDGYPLMPPVDDNIELKKEELEDLLRRYLNAHYRLASGNRKSHVPFGNLCNDASHFVHHKYVPGGFMWKDPRNMTKAVAVDLCNHIRKRQSEYGPEEGFRFQGYFDGKDMVKAEYGRRVNEEQAAARAKKRQATRKEKGAGEHRVKKGRKTKPKEGALVRNIQDTPNTVNDIAAASAPEQRSAVSEHDGSELTLDEAMAYVPVIDPSLLASGESTGGTAVPQHQDATGRIINDIEMQILNNNGYPASIPINGPSEGPPRYYVPAAALNLLPAKGQSASDRCPMGSQLQVMEQYNPLETLQPLSQGQHRGKRDHGNADPILPQRSLRGKNMDPPDTNPPLNKTRKRTKNADTQAAEEAQQLLAGSQGSRHRRDARR
ncbi:hypothetical protein BYT27DRAFT_7248035 [Phlegmacium glaucopus]|nr:hypothetical protein BYT27DRAFT_7248035 [Phlegmacium glaucopus]